MARPSTALAFCLWSTAVALIALAVAAQRGNLFGDFHAFWCAGSVVLHGGNPYAAAPLYACESLVPAVPIYHAAGGIALPAPLPGYALAPFALLAMLPFELAAGVWLIVISFALYSAARSFGKIDDIGTLAAATVLAPIALLVAVPFGEVITLAVAGICACAVSLVRKRYTAAAIFAALAAIEPHVGVPALLALLFVREARIAAIAALAALAILDVAVARAETIVYFTDVLRAHALSETSRTSQFSLTWLLVTAGVPDSIAVVLGSGWYIAMVATGIAVGRRLSRRFGDPSFAILVPPAFAVIGGPFLHLAQILVAVPALFVLRRRGPYRTALTLALSCVALPWIEVLHNPWTALAIVGFAGCIAGFGLHYGRPYVLAAMLSAAILCAAVGLAQSFWPASPHATPTPAIDPGLAEAAWASWIHGSDSFWTVPVWLAKVPVWFGLGWFAFAAVAGCMRAELRTRENVNA